MSFCVTEPMRPVVSGAKVANSLEVSWPAVLYRRVAVRLVAVLASPNSQRQDRGWPRALY